MHSSINGFCFSKSIAAGDIYHGQPYSTYIYIYIMDCRNTFIQPSLESPPPISIHLEMMRYANYPHPLHIQIYSRAMNQYIRMYQAKDNSKFHCSFDLSLGNNRVVMMIVVSLSLCNKIEIPQPNIVNHNYTIEWRHLRTIWNACAKLLPVYQNDHNFENLCFETSGNFLVFVILFYTTDYFKPEFLIREVYLFLFGWFH